MKHAFEELFKQMPMLPHRIYSDRGTEFIMKDFFKEADIQKFKSSTKTIKASLAEKAIRNLKLNEFIVFFQSIKL